MGETGFQDVRRGLRAEDVFTDPAHKWKTKAKSGWKGGCPWHDSKSGTCFSVNPETLAWKCFNCKRGGGPLEYAAELENIGSGCDLSGEDFFRAWEALAERTGCEPPPEKSNQGGSTRNERDPLKQLATRTKKRAAQPAGGPARPDPPPPAEEDGPRYSEEQLRKKLIQYRRALKDSERARRYLEGRGLSVDTLHRYGCGYAKAGTWLQDGAKKNGRHIHRSGLGRIVTPHTTPSGRVVNLYGRAAGDEERWLKHRHLKGNPKGLFNGRAIPDGTGPLVICEASLDALSFIEAGHARTIAVHGKSGVPWKALQGNVETVVVALDLDAETEARELANQAALRGYEAHILTQGEAYGEAEDPNEALQAGTLDLSYIRGLYGEDASTKEAPTEDTPTTEPTETGARKKSREPAGGSEWSAAERQDAYRRNGIDAAPGEPADLIPYWNGHIIGYLGRWIWTRPEAPMGRVDDTLHADRALHKWIVRELDAGPERARDPERLETVLWKLYAAFGPEGPGGPPKEGAAVQAPFPAPYSRSGTVVESNWDARGRTWRVAVRPDDGAAYETQTFNRADVAPALTAVTSQT
jgi:hypothetical protein